MTDTVHNFLPQFFSRAVLNAVIALDSGAQAATWHSAPGYDAWGSGLATDEYEYASLRTVNGVEYAYSDGFGNADKSTFYPMEGVWDRMTINGAIVNLVLPDGPNGVSYLPRVLPDSGEIIVHQGGYLWSAPRERGGARARPFFWYGHFLFGTTRTNPGFQGDPKTIGVIELREVWWDSDANWVRGHPQTPGELPWKLVNGAWTPNQSIIVVPEQLDCMGRDVGHLWVGQDRDLPLHLQSISYGPELVPVTPAPKPPEVKVADESLLIAALAANTASNERSTAASVAASDRNTAALNALAARLVSLPTSPAPSPTGTTPPSPGPSTTPAPSTSTTPAPTSSNETPIALNGTLPWPAPRTNARRFLSMRGSDVAALRLNVPANATGHFGSLQLVYTTANMAHRDVCLSMSPNDFDNPIEGSSTFRDVVSPHIPICIAPIDDGAAVLQPGTTVYLNVRNVNVDADANCDAYISIIPTR